MNSSEYAKLYALQDEVLSTIFEEPCGFYLTGGTALSRFYLGHRYSDDLDLFTHDVGVFPDTFRLVHLRLQRKWPDIHLEVDGRDFKRLMLTAGQTKLKLDLISDRVPRIGIPVLIGNVYVDTVANILSNKISAVLGRDEARDVADLIFISRKRVFSWGKVISDTAEKESFQLEELLFRLRTFPVESLRTVPLINDDPLSVHSEILARIVVDVERRGANTAAEADAEEL